MNARWSSLVTVPETRTDAISTLCLFHVHTLPETKYTALTSRRSPVQLLKWRDRWRHYLRSVTNVFFRLRSPSYICIGWCNNCKNMHGLSDVKCFNRIQTKNITLLDFIKTLLGRSDKMWRCELLINVSLISSNKKISLSWTRRLDLFQKVGIFTESHLKRRYFYNSHQWEPVISGLILRPLYKYWNYSYSFNFTSQSDFSLSPSKCPQSILTLRKRKAGCCKILTMTYRTIWRHLPADRNFKYSHNKNILKVRSVEVVQSEFINLVNFQLDAQNSVFIYIQYVY